MAAAATSARVEAQGVEGFQTTLGLRVLAAVILTNSFSGVQSDGLDRSLATTPWKVLPVFGAVRVLWHRYLQTIYAVVPRFLTRFSLAGLS